MKKIIGLILIILLAGCSFVMPDDTEFMELVKTLDTPMKISQYMFYNFEYEYQAMGRKTPYQLYVLRKGDCNDFSNWVYWIGKYHGYKTSQLELRFVGPDHWLGIFDMGNYFIYTDNQFINTTGYDSIEDIVESYDARTIREIKGYKVYY